MVRPKVIFVDVDGTLTDGKLYIGEYGEVMKAFSVKDGFILARLQSKHSITPVVVSAKESAIVRNRCAELGIEHVYQGVEDKLNFLKTFIHTHEMLLKDTAYIGDDENDLDCINTCCLTGCPADAVASIKASVLYVCKQRGGDGAVREFVEWILHWGR